MKIKQLLITLFFSCSLLPPVSGQPTSALTTIGEPNCGQWASRKREPDKGWLLGYLSGASLWRVAKPKANFLKSVEAEQIFLWMDNYCRANPLSYLSDGADDLIFELIKRTPAQ